MKHRVLIAVLLAFVAGFVIGVRIVQGTPPAPAAVTADLAFRPFPTYDTIPPSPTPIAGLHDYASPVIGIPIPLPGPTATPWPTHKPKPKLAGGPYKPWRIFSANVMAARAWLDIYLNRYQFRCIDVLFDRESRWRVHAENKRSGAYGIPQALPGRKMSKYGDDWRDNALTQVRWGLAYIRGRYGSPCAALDHSYRTGWY